MAMNYLTRRAFLRSLGAAGVALPFYKSLESSVAEAQTAKPLRLILISSPHGTIPEYWNPQGTETDFNIEFENSILAPLAKFKSRLFIPIGVDLKVLYEKGGETGHKGGPTVLFTGTTTVNNNGELYPLGPSLDQALAQQFGGATKFRSVQLGVCADAGYSSFDSFHFGEGAVRLPSLDDPAKVYARMFADLVPSGGTTPDPAVAQMVARKQSVIDAVKGDLNRLSSRLAGPEKQKLDGHLAAIQDIERQIGLNTPTSTGGAGCQKPAQPGTMNARDALQLPALGKLQIDLLAQMCACDLTRFMSLQWMWAGRAAPMPWIGLDVNIHDDVAHRVGEAPSFRLQLKQVQSWYATQLAYLMEKLDAIPEGDGTVLDNTIILWANELGNPSLHDNRDQPFVIAGGAGGKFRMGRTVTYSTKEDITNPAAYPKMQAHNGILTGIAQAFGAQQDWFGDQDYKGALPGLLA